MAKFEIEVSPGKVYEIEAPDDATEEEAKAYLARQLAGEGGFQPALYGQNWQEARKAIKALPNKAEREKARRSYYDYVVAEERAKAPIDTVLRDHALGAAQNLPIVGEFLDEARAGAKSLERGQSFSHQMDLEEARRRAADATDYPGIPTPFGEVDTRDLAKTAGFVGGTLAFPLGRVADASAKYGAPALQWATRGLIGKSPQAVAAAGTGAAVGGAEAAGSTRGGLAERGAAGVTGAGVGAATGWGLNKLGGWIWGKATNKSLKKGDPKSSQNLKKASRSAYTAADNAGVRIDNMVPGKNGMTFSETLQDNLWKSLLDEGYDPATARRLFPGVNGLLDEFQRLTARDGMTLSELERLRQTLVNAAYAGGDAKSGTRFMAHHMQSAFDDTMKMLGTKQGFADYVAVGDEKAVKAAQAALKKARNLWHRGAKTAAVEDALERAHLAAEAGTNNLDNAIRQKLRELIAPGKKTRKMFSAGELRAIDEAITDGTVSRATLRAIGRNSPVRNSLSTIGLVHMSGTDLGTAAALGLGTEAARRASTMTTTRKAQDALNAISRGNTRRYNTQFQKNYAMPVVKDPRVQRAGQAAIPGGSIGMTTDPTLRDPLTPDQETLLRVLREQDPNDATNTFNRVYRRQK